MPQMSTARTQWRVRSPLGSPPSLAETQQFAATAAALICAAELMSRLLGEKGGVSGADTAPQSLPEGEFAEQGWGRRPVQSDAAGKLARIFLPIFSLWYFPQGLSSPSPIDDMIPDEAKWDLPFVHILNTRFMQSQGSLRNLALARPELFRACFLSTVSRQSNQDFLWIKKTYPNLDSGVRKEMVEILAPYPNYFLV